MSRASFHSKRSWAWTWYLLFLLALALARKVNLCQTCLWYEHNTILIEKLDIHSPKIISFFKLWHLTINVNAKYKSHRMWSTMLLPNIHKLGSTANYTAIHYTALKVSEHACNSTSEQQIWLHNDGHPNCSKNDKSTTCDFTFVHGVKLVHHCNKNDK